MSTKKSFISVYESIGGWKALQLWWNPDMGGFWEPWQTGIGAYRTETEAIEEAKEWAESEDLELKVKARSGQPTARSQART